jgi:flagellar hook-associated protein 3 FlgL
MGYSLEAIFNRATWGIARNSNVLTQLQEQAATGQDINKVSNSPIEANRILNLKSTASTKGQYLDRIDEGLSTLDLASAVLQGVSSGLLGVRTSITSAINGTASPTTRATLADDVNNTLEQMLSLANTQRLQKSLFGGANTEEVPYTVQRNSDGDISGVTYQGSQEERKVDVAPGVQVSWALSGKSLFEADTERTYTLYGSTGAAMGSGTSSVRGDVFLTVTDAGGGLYDLSIDGGTTTFTTTGVPANDSNIAVVNPSTGQVLYVDATGITSAGKEPVRVSGTYDIFNVLANIRDLLRNEEGLPEATIKSMLEGSLSSLEQVNRKVSNTFPVIGGRITTMTTLKESIEDTKVQTEEEISRLSDADITQIAMKLAKHEVLYEMSLSVAAKMFSLSLMDFIQ